MALIRRYTLKLLAETCVQRFHEVVLHGEPLVFSPLRPLRAAAEVESGSTFHETCLPTEVRKSFTKPTMFHGATPAETCFAAPLHTRFRFKSQRVLSRHICLQYCKS